MAENVSRPMKYPYTISAKIAQFPIKYYLKHSWCFKWWLWGCLLGSPLFYKLQKLSNSPQNKEVWRKKDEELFYGGHH